MVCPAKDKRQAQTEYALCLGRHLVWGLAHRRASKEKT